MAATSQNQKSTSESDNAKLFWIGDLPQQELGQLPPSKIRNPAGEPTWTSTLVTLIGISCMLAWLYKMATDYQSWLDNGEIGPAPTPSIVKTGIPVLFTALGVEVILSTLLDMDNWRFNDHIICIANGMLQQLFLVLSQMLASYYGLHLVASIPWNYVQTHFQITSIGGIKGVMIAIFARDFFYYFFHRSAHRIQLFWSGGHMVHHIPGNFNFATNLSQGCLQRLFSAFFYAPGLACFFPIEVFHIVFTCISFFYL